MSIAETLLPDFDDEAAITRKFLELIPDDKLSWKPHRKSMELGQLAWHLAEIPGWCLAILGGDILKMSQADAAQYAHSHAGKQRADMLANFDRKLPEARAALAKAGDDDLNRRWKMEWEGQVVIDSPRKDVLRKSVLNHMVHHRAQLGLYLRLNDIPIPGPYGPSADEMGG
ncbi:MAG: DinB family protein [Bryobacteraceae bacterium]